MSNNNGQQYGAAYVTSGTKDFINVLILHNKHKAADVKGAIEKYEAQREEGKIVEPDAIEKRYDDLKEFIKSLNMDSEKCFGGFGKVHSGESSGILGQYKRSDKSFQNREHEGKRWTKQLK